MSSEDCKKGLNIALRFLSYRARHSIEVKTKLKEEGISGPIVKSVIERLEELGYINDSEWLDRFVTSEIKKKRGRRQILQKLFQKGICFEEVEKAVNKYYSVGAEIENIRLIIKKNKHKERQKIIQSLLRKGFSYELIKEEIE